MVLVKSVGVRVYYYDISFLFSMIRDPYLPELEDVHMSMPLPEKRADFNVHGAQTIYTWDSPEYMEHERGRTWYIGMSLCLLVLLGYSFYLQSFVMAVSFIFFAFVYMRVHSTGVLRMIHIRLSDRGMVYGDEFIEYGTVKKFYFLMTPQSLALHIFLDRKISPERIIYLKGDEDMEIIRKQLAIHGEELHGVREDTLHYISRLLKL